MNRNELLRGLLTGVGTWLSLLLLRTAMDAFACYEQGSYNDYRIAKSIKDSIDFAAKRQVWQRMIP